MPPARTRLVCGLLMWVGVGLMTVGIAHWSGAAATVFVGAFLVLMAIGLAKGGDK